MKKYYILSIFFLVNLQVAFSQIVISSKYRHFDSPSICKIVEIIDARQEKDNVGLIINKASKRIDSVKLETKLEDYLKYWLGFSVVEHENHFKYSLALKVNYIEFNKRKVDEDTRYWLFYDVELYVKNPDSTYSKVYDGIETLEGRADYGHKNDTDTQQFELLHWHLWNELQKKINFIKYKNVLKTVKHQTFAEINKPFVLAPVLTADSLQKGSYDDVNELSNNNPKIKLYNIKERTTVSIDSMDKKIQRVIYPNEWYVGYCDGKQIYGNYNMTNTFIPLERLGTVFEASGFAAKVYNIDGIRQNRINNLALSAQRAVAFPSNLNSGLAAASAVSLLVNLMRDSPNTRVILDIRNGGKFKKMPFIVLR